MIKTKEDLRAYLFYDKQALGKKYSRPKWNDEIWKFERALRYHEYYYNNKSRGCIYRLICAYWAYKHHNLGIRLGFSIPVNTCEKGLRLNHYGSVVINGNARLGAYCDIHSCGNIGQKGGGQRNAHNVPSIGNHVWIGPGVKIFGKISVADYCEIGANAVVNKSCIEPGSVLAGCPAKVIRIKSLKMNMLNKEKV